MISITNWMVIMHIAKCVRNVFITTYVNKVLLYCTPTFQVGKNGGNVFTTLGLILATAKYFSELNLLASLHSGVSV